MKNFITLLLACIVVSVHAQNYKPVDVGSKVEFKIDHKMIGKSTVTGTFSGLKGTISFDPKALQSAAFDVTVSVTTIKTGIGMRDNDLKKEKFFNEAKYPEIRIKSTKVVAAKAPNTYILYGNLTMKGLTQPVEISFTATPSGTGYTFKGQLTANRVKHGVGEAGGSIGEVATVNLTVQAVK